MNIKTQVTPLALLLAVSISSAWGQAIPNAGSLLRETQQLNKTPLSQTATPAMPSATQASAPKVQSNAEVAVQQIEIEGVTQLPVAQVHALVQDVENTTLTLDALQNAVNRITAYYQQAGYPLAQAVIPPQKISNGVVKVLVLEGKVATTPIENHSLLKDAVVNQYLSHSVPIGSILSTKKSERALLLMKDLAGTDYIGYQISAGEQAGSASLLTRLESAPRFSGFVSANNYGSRSTGEWRTRAGININSPFGYGERFGLQAMTSFRGFNYIAANASIPLGYDGLSLGINASHLHYKLIGDFKPLNAKGDSDTVGLNLTYPLIRTNKQNLSFTAGGEYRKLHDIVGANDVDSKKNLQILTLGANYSLENDWLNGGYTQLAVTDTIGRLRINSQAEKQQDALYAKTAGQYNKFNFNLNHTQFLTKAFSVTGSLSAQLANKNLDSSEQLSLGGEDAVSAYRNNAASVDDGVIAQVEAGYHILPAVKLSAFYGLGRGRLRHDNYLQEANYQSLHGAGIGLAAQYINFSLSSKLAWQTSSAKFANNHSPAWWVNFSYVF